MVRIGVSICPGCGGALKHYDSVRRIVRTNGRKTRKISVQRLRCTRCRTLHRELPDAIFPYKQYETEVIMGVLEGFITSDTLGYEDYPCEMTMLRWTTRKSQLLLWRGNKGNVEKPNCKT